VEREAGLVLIEFDCLTNRLCQCCCPFLIMGWLKADQIVCDYCHKHCNLPEVI